MYGMGEMSFARRVDFARYGRLGLAGVENMVDHMMIKEQRIRSERLSFRSLDS